MRLNPDLKLFRQVFDEDISPPPTSLLQLTMPTIMAAITQAARQHFQVEFEIEPLSDREWLQVNESIGALSCGVTHPTVA
jgi:lipoate-protein ligase A